MLTIIEKFYDPNDLGLFSLYFMNLPFNKTHQSKQWPVSDRMQAYPCYESDNLEKSENQYSPYQIFKSTFERKTNKKLYFIESFLRKIKLEELKNSAVYKKDRPHKDPPIYDYAGLVYFNSNSIKDGNKIYDDERDFEPTVIVGSKVNRCVFYNSQQPHSTPYDQMVEERWVQPFFIITEEETYKRHKGEN